MTQYFAHSDNKAGSSWEPLKEHLQCVAQRAGQYADSFEAKEEAMIAGWWHDLGKYSELFTERLKGNASGLDHWMPGAIAALDLFKDKAIAAALAIQGHHIGLQQGLMGIREEFNLSRLLNRETHPLRLTLTEKNIKTLLHRFEADGFVIPSPPKVSHYDLKLQPASAMLDARMLFSALVDADYIETEAHFEGTRDGTKVYRADGPLLEAAKALKIVLSHLEDLTRNARLKSDSSKNVQTIRKHLLDACLAKAATPQGAFTLTAPTGAGKTLAMLAFALKHAKANPHIRRIIMVVPFLSIIEQTAAVYRRLMEPHFGPHYVLEHHSLADIRMKGEDDLSEQDNVKGARRTARLLAENWDAPLVLTTSVQFFESLFANRPAKCRKLHRLANSIILFDEVQTLPPRIAVPSLASLSRLAERYKCTVVFSTATQPAFDHLHDKVKRFAGMGWQPQAIVEELQGLFKQSQHRVKVDWQIKESRSWESIAAELAGDENSRSLCIVNLKRHAQKLTQSLCERLGENGLFHLSTNMCPAHREKVFMEVRNRLVPGNSQPCRLISTQCIEAGVDVDFPVVFRAFGPLDAIAQAAGRCNREDSLGHGRMVVFLPEKEYSREYLYPPGGYKDAAETTNTLFKMKENEAKEKGIPFEDVFNIISPELFKQYYRLLYDLTGATDLEFDLEDALQRRSFVDVAQQYRLIAGSINVLVPYADEMPLFEALKNRLEKDGRLTRQWIQDARPLTVSLFRPNIGETVWNYLNPAPLGRGEKADDWFIYLNPKDYDPLLGLKPPNEVEAWQI